MNFFRVSCSGFGVIKIDGKYLACYNTDKHAFFLFGGAYRFSRQQKSTLDNLHAEYYPEWGNLDKQRKKKDRRDLRLILPQSSQGDFLAWFRKRKGRELDPKRELLEELVTEEHLLSRRESNFALYFLGSTTYTDRTQTPHCLYLWDYFEVELTSPTARETILGNLGGSHSALLKRQEIERGVTEDGYPIAFSVQRTLRLENHI